LETTDSSRVGEFYDLFFVYLLFPCLPQRTFVQ